MMMLLLTFYCQCLQKNYKLIRSFEMISFQNVLKENFSLTGCLENVLNNHLFVVYLEISQN